MIIERTSIMDPVGDVFYENDEVYRGIRENYVEYIMKLFDLGIIDELNTLELIPVTRVADISFREYPLVLHHERANGCLLPQEWSFSMIKDAAQVVLDVEKILLKYGYTLKDGHSYNVMFHNNRPVFVDLGSIQTFNSLGYAAREFYSYFDQLLEMFVYCPSIARERLLSRHQMGVRFNCLYLYGVRNNEEKYIQINEKLSEYVQVNDVEQALSIIYFEEKRINNYYMEANTEWGNYQDKYSPIESNIVSKDNKRFLDIVDVCRDLEIKSVLEIGANQGNLSRMLAGIPSVKRVIASDYDEVSVDKLYHYLCSSATIEEKRKIIPMVYDITSEHISSINYITSWKRVRSQMLIACALTHHLLLSQHINIDSLFEKLNQMTEKYMIIEFMPLGLWDGEKAPELPGWYSEEWFNEKLSKRFNVIKRKEIGANRIMYVTEVK